MTILSSKPVKLYTLSFVHEPQRILLGMKKKGFGTGLWNGFGGKVEPGEAIETAARRELHEETGLVAESLEERGVNQFDLPDVPHILEVHVFHVSSVRGEANESDEMKPQWFRKDEIPYHAMWSDDKVWLPPFLAGKRFKGQFRFDAQHAILDHEFHAS